MSEIHAKSTEMPVFGTPQPDRTVIERPGAYGLPFDFDGRIGVVDTPNGIYMLGGGVELGETPVMALAREVVEEIGQTMTPGSYIGKAAQYLSMPDLDHDLLKIGSFYLIELGKTVKDPEEADHELLWLDPGDALASLRRDYQRWALREILGLNKDG